MNVGIVGAGITGLALTHYLAEADIDSIAFEAEAEPGGVIQTRHVDGHILEVGPQRMRKSPGIESLARTAGVEDAMIEAPEAPLFVYANGSLGEAPLSAGALLRTNLISWRAKARLLLEPLTDAGDPEESVADLFTRKFGREVYERFVGPLYGGLYGSDPTEMPAAFALEDLLERERETGSMLRAFRQRIGAGHQIPPVSFEAGNQQLPNALAATYGDRIELETRVRGIERAGTDSNSQTSESEGTTAAATEYIIESQSGPHRVDELVVTTPARVTADLLDGVVKGASALDSLRYNRLALVFLSAEYEREGKGYQVGFGEDLHTLGVSWNASLFDREGLYTAFLGGMHEPDILDASDAELARIAATEFETVTGSSATAIDVARLDPGFPAWDESWWALEDIETPPSLRLATNYTARMGIPSRVREARDIASDIASENTSETTA